MLLLGVGTAVLVQATTGQKQDRDARPESSPCSTPPQQHVLAEVEGFYPKVWVLQAGTSGTCSGKTCAWLYHDLEMPPVCYLCWWGSFFFGD